MIEGGVPAWARVPVVMPQFARGDRVGRATYVGPLCGRATVDRDHAFLCDCGRVFVEFTLRGQLSSLECPRCCGLRADAHIKQRQAARHAQRVERRLAQLTNHVRDGIRGQVAAAVRRGKIVRPPACSHCGKAGRVAAHHEDYSKPLDVTWLCSACHRTRHWRLSDADRDPSVAHHRALLAASLEEAWS